MKLDFLEKGDLVYVIAPGYPFSQDLLKKAVQELESWGLQVEVPKQTLKPHLFHAQTDQKRLDFLIKGLLSKKVKAIWSVRGGYGSNRLVPDLLSQKVQLKQVPPKWFIGLSDVTSLHLFFNQKLGWPTLHGPVLEALGREDFPQKARSLMKKVLFGKIDKLIFTLESVNQAAKAYRSVKPFKIRGGNLAVLQSHIGTPLSPNLKNRFLFLEDIGERGYRIDRMLEHLIQSGSLKGCQGILFGEFTGGVEPDGSFLIDAAIKRFADTTKLPVFKGIPSGHGLGNQSIVFETPAYIKNSQLEIQLR